MTSSLTPLVNANWAATEGRKGDMSIYPMTLRVQADYPDVALLYSREIAFPSRWAALA